MNGVTPCRNLDYGSAIFPTALNIVTYLGDSPKYLVDVWMFLDFPFVVTVDDRRGSVYILHFKCAGRREKTA